jgi:alkanesulfonate monooxygenase SsuD/methylene tetrahydromethanopterin reductase-like flavin-dependent oxidoreductase (luciferase family)
MKIGIVINLSEDHAVGRAPCHGEIRGMAQGAEEAGLDSIWLFDHLILLVSTYGRKA